MWSDCCARSAQLQSPIRFDYREPMLKNPLAMIQTRSSYRWVMLALCALTALCVLTLPNMSLPPMFAAVSQDLGLSLMEIGTVWGIGSFAGIFFALIGGALGDRFGTRATLFT